MHLSVSMAAHWAARSVINAHQKTTPSLSDDFYHYLLLLQIRVNLQAYYYRKIATHRVSNAYAPRSRPASLPVDESGVANCLTNLTKGNLFCQGISLVS